MPDRVVERIFEVVETQDAGQVDHGPIGRRDSQWTARDDVARRKEPGPMDDLEPTRPDPAFDGLAIDTEAKQLRPRHEADLPRRYFDDLPEHVLPPGPGEGRSSEHEPPTCPVLGNRGTRKPLPRFPRTG